MSFLVIVNKLEIFLFFNALIGQLKKASTLSSQTLLASIDDEVMHSLILLRYCCLITLFAEVLP